MNGAVGILKTVELHITPQGDIAKLSLNQGKILTMKLTRDFTLNEDSEAFVKPEALPVLACDCVTSPRMGNLVSSNVNLREVTNDDGWRSKS